jgi:hypothetical protein
MRAYITTHAAAQMSGADIRRIRKVLAEIQPHGILLTRRGIVPLYDIGVAESLVGIRMRPIQVQLEHVTGKN